MARKLTKDELLAIVKGHETQSLGTEEGDLSTQRADSLDRYLGEPYGDEVDGRSTVVSKDLKEAVDWIMPSLIRVYLSTNDFLRFDPVGPEDEQLAEQESDYTNHVIMKENNGFILLHDWFKDALLLKNGYVKYWWDTEEKHSHETYGNLTEEEIVQTYLQLVASGDDIEIVGHSTTTHKDDLGNDIDVYEIKIRRTKKYGCVKVEPVPPEELRISRSTRGNLQKSPFVQHVTKKRRSELIEMGLDKDFVDALPKYGDDDKAAPETRAREQTTDEVGSDESVVDKSMDEIEYKESYLRVDWDADDIAELRKVVVVGNKIPDGDDWNEEVDDIPFAYLTPNRMPHRHVGLSLNDDLEDIARIKTTLWRQLLDNTYLLNNLEWLVNERVNLPDFMTSRPGGIKRVTGKDPVEGAAAAVTKTPILQHVLPVLDYMDGVKENRTGVGRNVMGLDPDTLQKTTEGAARMALQQANAKIEMIARLFGETGIKDLALSVHALLVKHMDKQKIVKLRNKWVPVNPQEWRERTDLTVNVGLGTGSQEEIRSNLMLMSQLQEQAAAGGIVSPRNRYNLSEKISDLLGFKQQGMFFTDPDSPEGKQLADSMKQGNPLAEVEQVKGQFKLHSEQMAQNFKQAIEQYKLQFEQYKFHLEHALEMAKAEIDAAAKGVNADLGQPGIGAETKTGDAQAMNQNNPEQPANQQQQASQQANQQLVDSLAALSEQNQAVLQAVAELKSVAQTVAETSARPRKIELHRDASGRAIGATSTLQ